MGRHLTDFEVGGIREMHRQKKSITYIAERYKVARATVRKHLTGYLPSEKPPRRLPTKQKKAIEARRKRIRKLALTKQTVTQTTASPVRKIVRTRTVVLRRYASARSMARKEKNVSSTTVLRDLKAVGLRRYSSWKAPHLEKQHLDRRMAFCKRVLRMPLSKLRTIRFSDEKQFDAQTRRFLSYYDVAPDPESTTIVDQGAPRMHVWGCISRRGKVLHVVKQKRVNRENYPDILKQHLPFIKRGLFMQDNARPHVATVNDGFFRKHKIKCLNWPPYSPDLNPIETCWAIVGERVKKEAPFGDAALERFVLREWKNMTQATVRGLVDEFRERCEVCLKNGGRVVTSSVLRAHRAAKAKAAQQGPGRGAGKKTKARGQR